MFCAVAVLVLLLGCTTAQDANCDFQQPVTPGQRYYVYSPRYPNNYSAGIQCRWVASCPSGYNCRLDCTEINLPYTTGCTQDRLMISKTGDPQLNSAERYCGYGSLTAVSSGQSISVGLITANNSPGGRFVCELTAQTAQTPDSNCRCGYKKGRKVCKKCVVCEKRIVGGQETDVNEYPMMVGVVDRRIFQIKCGGVIINPNTVLTAGHCLYQQSVANYAIVVGEHDVNAADSPATTGYAIASFIIHPGYTPSNYDYDAALVNTVNAIQFSDLVGPVCLPFKFVNTDFTGKYLTALGWGTLFAGGPVSNVLRKVDLQVISQASCRQYNPLLTDRQMCTLTPGKDSCQDDSGGPLLQTDAATGLEFCHGIISAGQLCASSKPSINTRVASILSWIQTYAPYPYCRK